MNQKIKHSEATKRGYKRTPIKGIYINIDGILLDTSTGEKIKPKSNATRYKNRFINVAKCLLFAFKSAPIQKTKQIRFKDSNNLNFSLDNIEYKCLSARPNQAPNETKIEFCLQKLYKTKYKISKQKSPLYFMGLTKIFEVLRYNEKHNKTPDFDLFEKWIYENLTNKNKIKTSIKNGYSQRDGLAIINHYLNQMVNDFESLIIELETTHQPKTTE